VTDGPSRVRRTRRRAIPWFIGAALLLSVGLPSASAISVAPSLPAVGLAHPMSTTENVTVNMTDLPSFSPQFTKIPAGTSLALHLVNRGAYNHTFTLAKTPNVRIPSTLTPAQLDAFFAANGTLANVSVASGGQGWANLTFNASEGFDSFEFASVVPYQFQAGMWGLLNLSSTAPGLELGENTTNTPGFLPDELSATPLHYPIVIAVLVTNEGTLGHTFTLAPQSNVTLLPTNYTTYFASHAPLVNANVPALTGGTAWANFTISSPGVYMYICEISGHFAAGMFGYLYVGVPVPAPPAPPSTAIVDGWVLVGSALLVGIGVVFVALAAFAGRFPPRSTPPGHHA